METAKILWTTILFVATLVQITCPDGFVSNEGETLDNRNHEQMLLTIQQIILNKLGLEEPPKVKYVKPILQRLDDQPEDSRSSVIDNNNENHEDTTSKVLFSEIDRSGTSVEHSTRFYFYLGGENLNLSTVELWMYKNNSVDTFTLTQIFYTASELPARRNVTVSNQQSHIGWIRFQITHLGQLAVHQNHGFLDLEVTCVDDCPDSPIISQGESHRPLLILTKTKIVERSKRDCHSSGQSCHREPLYISFAELGFDSWIYQPDGCQINYCKGSCKNEIGLAKNTHSTIIMSIISNNKSLAESLGLQMSCTPSLMSPMMFIYIVDNDTVRITNATNMIVQSCACA